MWVSVICAITVNVAFAGSIVRHPALQLADELLHGVVLHVLLAEACAIQLVLHGGIEQQFLRFVCADSAQHVLDQRFLVGVATAREFGEQVFQLAVIRQSAAPISSPARHYLQGDACYPSKIITFRKIAGLQD